VSGSGCTCRVSKRLLASYVTLTIVVLAALEIPLGIQYGRSETRDLTNRIARDALIMATFAEDPLERGATAAPAGLVKAALDYQQTPGGRVVITNRQGVSIVDTRDPIGQQMRTPGRPEIAQALGGNVASGTRHSNSLGTDLIYVAVPIASAGHVRGSVRITYPTSALDARVNRYWLLLAAIGGVVLAAATLIGLRFARTLTQPLSALEQTAAEVGEGDLTARAPETGPPEIRALAARFNETVARLDALLGSQQAFVADASHQLRTPLAALRLRLENLERDVEPAGKRDLEAALQEVERLGMLVDGLLVLARADAAVPAVEPISLSAVVGGRIGHWSPHAAERGVALESRVELEDLRVLATPGALEQVLDNLLSNAIAVSPAGAAVSVEARADSDAVEVHVLDHGPGMSTEQRARAFDRFWRAGPPGSGTGLGLAIVHRLVTADGGKIELREAPGGGLDAAIRLRRATSPEP
jgi:signal transduction histidine kinase